MDKQRQEQVISALKEKGATQPCPRCQNLQFDVVGETVIGLDTQPWFLGGARSGVPAILVSCSNCGYIAQHAAAVLGLLR